MGIKYVEQFYLCMYVFMHVCMYVCIGSRVALGKSVGAERECLNLLCFSPGIILEVSDWNQLLAVMA